MRLFALLAALYLVAFTVTGAAYWQSRGQSFVAAVGYVGPGDVVASASGWYGVRGYSAAYATGSNPGAKICDTATGVTCVTANIKSNGDLDVSGLGTVCATACNLDTLYDQTGGGKDLTQSTNASRPVVTLNCIGALPCIGFTAGGLVVANGTGIGTHAQQFSVAGVINEVASSGSPTEIFGGVCLPAILAQETTITGITLAAASAGVGPTMSLSVFRAAVGVFNGASSTVAIDDGGATTISPSPGTTAWSGAIGLGYQGCWSGAKFVGSVTEVGMWPVGFTGTQQTTICHNIRGYWGTPGSC